MTPHEHIVKAFEKELQRLHARATEMGALTAEQVSGSVDAIEHADAALAEAALDRDRRIDALQHELIEAAFRLVAPRQPMACDLREAVAASKIAGDLERVGDLAKNVAKRAHILPAASGLAGGQRVVGLGRMVHGRVRAVAAAYPACDAAAADDVWQRDQEVDDGYHGAFHECLTYMMEDPHTIGVYTHLLPVAKNIERVGDHCANVASSIHYLVEGAYLDDARPKGGDTAFTLVDPPPGS
jgi:phosphate transport system protein